MGMRCITRMIVICMFSSMAPVSVWAANYGQPGGGGRREPPKEAFEVCKDKSEGDAVEITTPRGDTIKAVCKKFKNQLVAVPEGAPPPPPGGGNNKTQETGN